MKLFDQANQYWINLENKYAAWDRPPNDIWDRMKEELEIKYMCHHHLMLVSWTIGTNTLKTTNLLRSMWRNLMNFSSDAVLFIRKGKLKFFLDSERILKMTYELNC